MVILQELIDIAPNCIGEWSSEGWVRQLRESGKNEEVIKGLVIEAETIERCRLATVARLKEIEKELEGKADAIKNKYSENRLYNWSPQDSKKWDGYYDQRSIISRLLDYFSRPARYKAMVKREKKVEAVFVFAGEDEK